MSSRDKMLWIYGTFRWCLLLGVQYNFNWDLYPHPQQSTQPISCPSGRSTGAASQNLRLGVSPSCPGNGLDDPLTGHETETQVSNFDLMLWRLWYSWRTGLYVYSLLTLWSHTTSHAREWLSHKKTCPKHFNSGKKKHDSSIKFAVWLSSVKPEGRVCPAPLWSKVTIQKASPKMGHGVGVKKTEMTKDDKGILRISLFTVSCYIHQPNQETNKPRKNSLPPPDQKVADVWGCSHHQDLHVETKPLCRWDSPKPAAASVRMFA